MSSPTAVEVRRRLPAPVDEVFDWWTDARLLARWMTPTGTCEATVDARKGGALRVVMSGDGVVIEHVGEFLDVERPRRLVFTWSSPYTGPRPTVVTVELVPAPDGTTDLTLIHEELPETTAASHGGGWTAMLARLQTQLEARDGD